MTHLFDGIVIAFAALPSAQRGGGSPAATFSKGHLTPRSRTSFQLLFPVSVSLLVLCFCQSVSHSCLIALMTLCNLRFILSQVSPYQAVGGHEVLTKLWFTAVLQHLKKRFLVSNMETSEGLTQACCSVSSRCVQMFTRPIPPVKINICIDLYMWLTDSVMYVCTPSAYCRA